MPSNQLPVIAWGGAAIGQAVRGKKAAVAGKIRLALQHQERNGRCKVIDIDETRTSMICSSCKTQVLEHAIGAFGQRLYAVLKCAKCNIYWNRDQNASRNMHFLASYLANHDNQRPAAFKKKGSGSSLKPCKRIKQIKNMK